MHFISAVTVWLQNLLLLYECAHAWIIPHHTRTRTHTSTYATEPRLCAPQPSHTHTHMWFLKILFRIYSHFAVTISSTLVFWGGFPLDFGAWLWGFVVIQPEVHK